MAVSYTHLDVYKRQVEETMSLPLMNARSLRNFMREGDRSTYPSMVQVLEMCIRDRRWYRYV